MAKLHFNGASRIFLSVTELTNAGLSDIVPSYASEISSVSRTKKVQFGDGYAQEAPDGLNPTGLVVTVVFENKSRLIIKNVVSFLEGTGGTPYDRTPDEYFYWTVPVPPYDTKERKFKYSGLVTKWKSYDVGTVSVTFTETFEI